MEEMSSWNRYPTYDVYIEMMNRFATDYPTLCRLDTIGFSVHNRLILCAVINKQTDSHVTVPEFFYSSSMHGDELTGYYFMLRLIDTLLRGYGVDNELTTLIENVEIFINPLANPDGTYYGGDSTVSASQRYNANGVDLNRNWPDPFGVQADDPLQPENQAMMDYMSSHNFRLSANLHGGAEVMNYPWDSFTLAERSHPDAQWWQEVGQRFVDTVRATAPMMYRTRGGVTSGGDWYVISNGRQDWVNYYLSCREITMEVSNDKILATNRLDSYWKAQQRSLVNYIKEIYNCPTSRVNISAPKVDYSQVKVRPNPTTGPVTIETTNGIKHIDLSGYAPGVYIIPVDGIPVKIIKQ